MDDQGKEITRLADGIVMRIESVSDLELIVSFEIPEGAVLSGRVQVLKGKYRFRLR
jgi:hypothetical protein